MIKRFWTAHYFLLSLSFLCMSYLAYQIFFNAYALIFADEFWFAHAAYQFKHLLPYKDFPPYKTVVGYYLLLLPLIFAQTKSLLATYIFVKNSIAVLNTIVFFAAAIWLRKFFNAKAILLSIALLVTAENVLSYSTNIRVDLFAYWFCLFSILFLLEKRFLNAGILLGLAFAISQKTIWYIVAIDFAFAMQWIIFQRSVKSLRPIITFNLSCIAIIVGYILFWATFSSLETVINSVFFEAKVMYELDWYATARIPFWALVLFNNPVLFLLWPLTALSLFVRLPNDQHFQQRFFLLSIAACIFVCLIPYKQVFPYYMQVAFPIFIVLYAAFFSWLFDFFAMPNTAKITSLGKHSDWIFAVCYLTVIFFLIAWLQLLTLYLLLGVIPFILIHQFGRLGNITPAQNQLSKQLITLILVFVGFIYPLTLFIPSLPNVSGRYQKANMEILSALLADGGDYVAGADFIYDKTQPIAGMQHLNGPAVNFLYEPFIPKLRAAMIASLNFNPGVTVFSIINELKKSNVKVYVNNYRMNELPNPLKKFLASQYTHYWGSLYIYAPEIKAGNTEFFIKFTGNYLITSDLNHNISLEINGKNHKTQSIVKLKKGFYRSIASANYRLQFIPNVITDFYPHQFKVDYWGKMI